MSGIVLNNTPKKIDKGRILNNSPKKIITEKRSDILNSYLVFFIVLHSVKVTDNGVGSVGGSIIFKHKRKEVARDV